MGKKMLIAAAIAGLMTACLPEPMYTRAPGNDASAEQFERDKAQCQANMIVGTAGAIDEVLYRQNCMRAKGWVQTN